MVFTIDFVKGKGDNLNEAVLVGDSINTRNDERSCRVSVDRISHLPSDVTGRILQFLPLNEAVRTSILSAHWRYQWALRPQLILDQDVFDKLSRGWSYRASDRAIIEYSSIVYNILRRHVGPVHEFVHHIPDWIPGHVDVVSPWCRFLSGKFVQKFTLIQEQATHMLHRKLHSYLFSCEGFNKLIHLTHLTLINIILPSDLPATFTGFPSLISLQLHMQCRWGMHNNGVPSTCQADALGIFISKCPLLQSLDLQVNEGKSSLAIHAPKLQRLSLSGFIFNLYFKEAKHITTLSLLASLKACLSRKDLIIEFFTCLSHVEELHLGGNFWEILQAKIFIGFGLPRDPELPIVLVLLKHLILDTVTLLSLRDMSSILSFLKIAPKLQKLEINVSCIPRLPEDNMIIEEECHLSHLKFAKLSCDRCCSRIMLPLGKLILSSSPVLEVMIFEARVTSEESLKMDKRVSRVSECYRASANVDLIFNIEK